jgi:hypothetical protein
MESEKVFGLLALLWLVGSFLSMARLIRAGRALVDVLAARHPELYEALGRARPGYFESARGTRFAQFVGRREFESLADASLFAEFEAYRKSEVRLIVGIFASGAFVVLPVFTTRHFA